MITDKQITAAMDVIKSYDRFVSADTLRHALEAYEAAAWCDDIGQAPRDETWILCELHGSPSVITALSYFAGLWEDHMGAGFPDDIIKRWRHLPQPPKDETK